MPLKFRIFLHSYLGFNSNSTLLYGEKDAVLVDASQLLSDTHRMVAEIILDEDLLPPNKKETLWCYVSLGFASSSSDDAHYLLKCHNSSFKSGTHAGCESGTRAVTSLSPSL